MTPPQIPNGAVVLVDSPAFIYLIGRDPQYYVVARALFERAEAGEISAVASTLVLSELLVPYFRSGDARRARAVAATLQTQRDLQLLELTARIAETARAAARRLRAAHT